MQGLGFYHPRPLATTSRNCGALVPTTWRHQPRWRWLGSRHGRFGGSGGVYWWAGSKNEARADNIPTCRKLNNRHTRVMPGVAVLPA